MEKSLTIYSLKHFYIFVFRGLDIPHIRTVVNFDLARDIETHTHRIGRTGRAGVKGTAYTLITEKDKEMAGHVVRNLEQANQDVPQDLMELALKSSWFKNSRFRKSGKSGLGFSTKDRPGFGQQSNSEENALENYLTSKEPSSSSGSKPGVIGQGRASALKSAFKSQYMSRFCKSSDSEANSTNTINSREANSFAQPPPVPPPPSEDSNSSRKRKSRWE